MENEADKDKKLELEKSFWFDHMWGMKNYLSKEILSEYEINKNSGMVQKIDDKDKPEFKKALVSSLQKRLQWLRIRANVVGVYMFMPTAAEEKEYWLFVAEICQKLELLDKDTINEFKRKILDVYDLNGFITVLQWLGCVLSVPCTLFLSLLSDKVRLRIQDPTTSHIFYRLQDSKDDLLSPFGIIAENNNEDSNSVQSGDSSYDESELTN